MYTSTSTSKKKKNTEKGNCEFFDATNFYMIWHLINFWKNKKSGTYVVIPTKYSLIKLIVLAIIICTNL